MARPGTVFCRSCAGVVPVDFRRPERPEIAQPRPLRPPRLLSTSGFGTILRTPAFVEAAARRAVAIESVPAPTIDNSIPSIVQRRGFGATGG